MFDAALRSTICAKPIRPAAGIKCLVDQDIGRLCVFAPTIFVPGYDQWLSEQATFIAGIARLLTRVLGSSRCIASQSSCGIPVEHGSHNDQEEKLASEEVQLQLWVTLINKGSSQKTAARLRPLRLSKGIAVADPMLALSHALTVPWQIKTQSGTGKILDFGLKPALDDNVMSNEHFSDFCHRFDHQANICWEDLPMVTTADFEVNSNTSAVALDDVELAYGEHRLTEVYNSPLQVAGAVGPPTDENRKYSKSLSHMSDVSMLPRLEGPMKDGCTIGTSEAIGGSSWLIQNAIRMHPLSQQPHEKDELDQQNCAGERNSLYERPDLEWWSATDDASEVPLEEWHDQYPTSHRTDPHSSLLSLAQDDDWLHEDLGLQHNTDEIVHHFGGCVTPMSTSQTEDFPTSSLSEVLGNDHLLWHMWQRRASVGPRGEQDITGLKTMFATDPDMKLFSSRWNLDPSDRSSSSSEDPMLQDPMRNLSPKDKPVSPSPTSERRSYFIPTSSTTASSNYVGRSGTDTNRRSSLIKRFTWGGRQSARQESVLDVSKLIQRTIEVKRRKTLDDYDIADREAYNDDSSDMLF